MRKITRILLVALLIWVITGLLYEGEFITSVDIDTDDGESGSSIAALKSHFMALRKRGRQVIDHIRTKSAALQQNLLKNLRSDQAQRLQNEIRGWQGQELLGPGLVEHRKRKPDPTPKPASTDSELVWIKSNPAASSVVKSLVPHLGPQLQCPAMRSRWAGPVRVFAADPGWMEPEWLTKDQDKLFRCQCNLECIWSMAEPDALMMPHLIVHVWERAADRHAAKLDFQRDAFVLLEPLPADVTGTDFMSLARTRFDWVSTYRWDADVPLTMVECSDPDPYKVPHHEPKGKNTRSNSFLIATFLSNCDQGPGAKDRLAYLSALMKHVRVHSFGMMCVPPCHSFTFGWATCSHYTGKGA